MTLIAADKLQDLIVTWPDLSRERRELLVDFMSDLPPADLQEFVIGEHTAAGEIPFIRACCGLPHIELARNL